MSDPLRYGHLERERRYLLDGVPPLPAGGRVLRLADRYLTGTRLRLRMVTGPGAVPVHKLGQKVQLDPEHPSTVAHTTVYLDQAEHALLRGLPGADLVKTRHLVPWGPLALAVDVFAGPLRGLVLAEVDLGSDGRLPPDPPMRWVADVTDDERFGGGALAVTPAGDLARLLDEHGLGRAQAHPA